ncbi:MAG: BirA family transcriptional regulator [Epulopiscium sp.]|jgi:BirA family biotin operon repressor/biotin-[acetyl-CoA-carboxylase] ligase|uniref:Bifunctional ligase/repressor BirA n=1 Tax=Defluviitalea raffinosedens TaxID=1450156 RepID=A0A7C8HFQ1_9FIRM|nr:biotin--[acetyl-CoA-carboxylase] ligase [Defluviitalea raffinosedens]KAE9636214.1 biotin--[acetyl-CoA-carboxylase] ligase [Defluviitalea raffinosedens]MBM7684927.1 BirA family biotin operon repressor/biotin-[acetyl-CoA-carboxylase] ligase [Defluviitalea raffinosedens]MDK2787390.1 BirA family transcriptional regulator [Candidatus Epulonipiscium sp.]
MKSKILQLLKDSDGYVSGEEISKVLGVSRTAIWKVISHLKEEGYVIESVTKKGYLLQETPDLLTEDEILYHLKTKWLGRKIVHYHQIDSTNKEAKKLAASGEKEGTIVISEEQLAGRGRLGRTWISPAGTGIWMSVILRPSIAPTDASKITLLAGLAVCEGIKEATGLPVQIKWPNDLVLHNKKICGILTEMSAEMEKINYIILGIGINVNTDSFPEDLKNTATSLKIEGEKEYDRKEIVKAILMYLEQYYELYMKNQDMEDLLEKYKNHCLTLGKEVKIIHRNEEFIGKAVDLSKEGELMVEKQDGQVITVFSGEVSVRGLYGYI